MPPKKKRRKWRNFLINRQVQVKVAAVNSLYMLMVVSLLIATLFMPLYDEIFSTSDPYYSRASAKVFIVLLERFSICFVILIFLGLFHQFVVTHKLCGPLANFSKTFKKISKNDLTRKVYLRRHDFLKNEARQINEMIDNLSSPLSAALKSNRRIVAMLEEHIATGATQSEINNVLRLLKKEADICTTNLEKFKLDDDLEESQCRVGIAEMSASQKLRGSNPDQQIANEYSYRR